MAFKKFSKRKHNTKKDLVNLDSIERQNLANLSFRDKIFYNQGEGLFNICLWLPFFASSWLVSGLLGQEYAKFTMIFFPLIFIFLFTESQLKGKETILPNKNILLAGLVTIYSLYLFYVDQRYIFVSLFFVAGQLRLFLPSMNFRKNNQSYFSFCVSALAPFVFLTCLMFLGIFSQTHEDFVEDDFKYLILALIPGTVFVARECLRNSQFLKLKGWRVENIIYRKSLNIKRPGGISRLVIGLMIIGPAIPALLLPFNIIPRSLFLVTFCFLKVPILAQQIQTEFGTFDERVINLTKFVSLVTFLTFVGAFLNSQNII